MRDLEVQMPLLSPIARTRLSPLTLLGTVLLFAGCPTRDEIDRGADGGGGGEGGLPPGPSIAVTAPTVPAYVSGSVQIEAKVTGGTAANVQLLRDDVAWQTVSGPPFRYTWATAGAPDGDYIITATAVVAGQNVTSAPVTITVDHTPPTITMLTPDRGASSVSLSNPLVVTFSEPVVPSTVSNASVNVTAGGAAVSSTVQLAADASSLTVTIGNTSTLALPASFAATIGTTITDRAGNTLAPLQPAWNWTVPAWLRLPPLTVDRQPRMALDSTGHPFLLYAVLETVNSNMVDDVYVARFDGSAWDTSFGAPTSATDTGRNGYSLALDSHDRPAVAWTEYVSQLTVHVGAWTGSAWNTQFPVLNAVSDPSTDATYPSLAVDGSDYPVVVWREATNASTADIFASRWNGSAWTALPGTGFMGGVGLTRPSSPHVVLTPTGAPIFGWFQSGIGNGLSFWTGSAWTTTQAIAPITDHLYATYPVVDSAGTAYLAAAGPDLRLRKWDSSLPNWTEPFSFLITSTSWSAPRLALARDGSPVVAWVDSTGPTSRIGVARWTAGAWDTRFGLFNAGQSVDVYDPNDSLLPVPPELAIDSAGKVWVAWKEGTTAQVWTSNF
jgi:Bacterial Ig-like domain/Bacterial Ig domain